MACTGMHFDINLNCEDYNNRSSWDSILDEVRGHAEQRRQHYSKGGEYYKRNDPYDSAWRNPTWKIDQPWPTHGNWIHEALMTYVDRKAYELPPTIYMRESFDGTWYPNELSSKKYKNLNRLIL